MLYLMNEVRNAMLAPARIMAGLTKQACENPFHPFAHTPHRQLVAASCEMFERATRTYAKPSFGLGVSERIVWEQPFCRVIAFGAEHSRKPKLLIVAPLSGHYATLLRGTVEAFLDTHQVFITDWADAKQVPLSEGGFGLSDYIDYCIEIFETLGPDLHVLAVCQPTVPVLAAIAHMEEERKPGVPLSAVLVGGPVDTRIAPTAVDDVATARGIDWFRRHCIHPVPANHPGSGRAVYPGFLQLIGFMSMNPDRHAGSHWEMFDHLLEGDGDSAAKHRSFYDEYLAVMDLTAEFYLETVSQVFIEHALPRGRMMHHGKLVRLDAIRQCGLMVVEGERDDITGIGQTKAALDLTANLPARRKRYHLQPGAGHYGIFNGSRFRAEIVPKLVTFMEQSSPKTRAASRPVLERASACADARLADTASSRTTRIGALRAAGLRKAALRSRAGIVPAKAAGLRRLPVG